MEGPVGQRPRRLVAEGRGASRTSATTYTPAAASAQPPRHLSDRRPDCAVADQAVVRTISCRALSRRGRSDVAVAQTASPHRGSDLSKRRPDKVTLGVARGTIASQRRAQRGRLLRPSAPTHVPATPNTSGRPAQGHLPEPPRPSHPSEPCHLNRPRHPTQAVPSKGSRSSGSGTSSSRAGCCTCWVSPGCAAATSAPGSRRCGASTRSARDAASRPRAVPSELLRHLTGI